jgi:hypothetical protein
MVHHDGECGLVAAVVVVVVDADMDVVVAVVEQKKDLFRKVSFVFIVMERNEDEFCKANGSDIGMRSRQ